MKKKPQSAQENFSFKAFGQGLAVVALVYAGVFAFISGQAAKTTARLESRLAAQAVIIQHVVQQAMYNYPPAPAPGQTAQAQLPPPPLPSNVEVPTGALEAAPLDGLYEDSTNGKLPKIGPTGLTPFNAYKRPFAYANKPVIALGVVDYGLSDNDSGAVIAKLPPEISLILSPYAINPEDWQKKARAAGHEVWLYLPMENAHFLQEDPGPKVLLTRASMSDNQDRLNWILGRATGYVGVVSDTDNVFLDMHAMLERILKAVFGRGLAYFELNRQGSEFIETMAFSDKAPYASLQGEGINLDEKVMKNVEDAAATNGFATLVIAPTPNNIASVKEWIATLNGKGFSLAPISAVATANLPTAAKTGASVAPAAPAAPAP